MNISKLTHVAMLRAPVDSVTGKADQVTTYTDDGKIGCQIQPLTARELIWASQNARADVTHKITIPFTARVNHRYQLLWNSRTFALGPSISEDEAKVEMVFTAVEVR